MTSRSSVLLALKLERTAVAALMALALASGCARGPETGYGSSRGSSLNGTGAFAALIRRAGHEVRTAWRLTEELADWADVIVRFAPMPGPLGQGEAGWYREWLGNGPERSLVYVVRDYDAQAEYWSLVLDRLNRPGDEERRQRAEAQRDGARNWVSGLPSPASKPADAADWFAVGPPRDPPSVCRTLEGSWASGIDARQAALTLHQPLLMAAKDHVLLREDGRVLAMDWEVADGNRVLAVANGSFLLNLPLVNPARRPLAERVVAWIGNRPRRVAFVDGPVVLGGPQPPPTLFDLLGRISSFRWVAFHFGLVGLLVCLARAPRLGRPRPEPPSDADRPAAHAEALGALLARTGATDVARDLLETYRRWRRQHAPAEEAFAPRPRTNLKNT